MIVRCSGTALYAFASLFPFIGVLLCWALFYSLGHFHANRLLTISETVIPFPENRIFPVFMNVEALVLILVYIIRNRVIARFAGRRAIQATATLRKWVCNLLTILVPIGLSMLSSCTLENNLAVHGFGALLFFYGSVLYYILTDWSLSAVGQPPPILSRILSWSLIPLLVAYMKLIGKSFERGPDWVLYATLGAVFQYITALLIFVKIFLFAFDVPEHYGAVIFADSSQ